MNSDELGEQQENNPSVNTIVNFDSYPSPSTFSEYTSHTPHSTSLRTPLSRLRSPLFSLSEENCVIEPPPRTNSCPTSLSSGPEASPVSINTGHQLPDREGTNNQYILDILELLPFCEYQFKQSIR